ncbi:MAG TPA: T9SS type A sorting domain-containing protein [Ferruginibacter sp.]|nr:T9SS type A sorting domain-containing protein [Ferruginibacter sp.]
MRHKILLLTLIYCFISNSLQAQDYPAFFNNSCWRVQLADFSFRRVVWLIPEKDTIIGSFTYKKYIDSAKNRLVSFIREDVQNKKVYRWWGSLGDKILFDFSLKLGDSITLANGGSYKVSNEDSLTISPGVKRRTLRLTSSANPRPEYWVEGIGTLRYPLINIWELSPDPDYNLLCSYQNGIPVYNAGAFPPYCQDDCCPTPPVIGDSKNHIYKWFPNPFVYKSTYLSEKKFENATMRIYNTIGQLVKEQRNISGYTINFYRDNLSSGLYFVQLFYANNAFTTFKLIIENK